MRETVAAHSELLPPGKLAACGGKLILVNRLLAQRSNMA